MTSEEKQSSRKQKFKLYKHKKKKGPDEETIIQFLQGQYDKVNPDDIKTFKDIPLTQKTLRGLRESNFVTPTEIQKQAITVALQGKDVLGAAKTGSGKTLAFLIPILEKLYCKKWTRMDGLGALVISPTRELAYQIYETLKKIGIYHDCSAGLIIGGQNLKFERKRMDQVNILICTPGRLLQHMDENPLFDCNNLQILVLDEADRCLDLGFETTMNGIIENLPSKRQTLLFSATQTKSVKDLARLSLSYPSYIAPHEQSDTSTPSTLQQSYIVCRTDEKLGILWSFIKNHLKHKTLVFMATCKQVKYLHEVFCKLRPGVSLLALYGTLHQERREKIYKEFCRKSNVVLFATDLASRGLDFPQVNWVIQMDCPENVETYIHRAGRTARGLSGKGEGLLMITSQEEAIVENLQEKKIPINKISVDPAKVMAPQRKIESLLAEHPDLKQSAQRAFVSYIKSVFLMKNKKVFNVQSLDTDAYARSLGLVVSPRVRFLQRYIKDQETKIKKNISEDASMSKLQLRCSSDSDSSNDDDNEPVTTNKNGNNKNYELGFHGDSEESDDDIFKVKRIIYELDNQENKEQEEVPPLQEAPTSSKNKKPLTKAAIAKKLKKKKIVVNTKVTFDEEGEAVLDEKRALRSELAKEYESENIGGLDIEKAKQVLQEEDKFDKIRFKEKVRAKHKEEKRKLKNKKKDDESEKDEFGSQSESEGPDLSWLPDPDKIYEGSDHDQPNSNGEESDGEKYNAHDSSSEEESQVYRPPKRKLVTSKGIPQDSAKPNKRLKVKEISATLSVNEAEELAMQLLKGRR